ncbi:Pkinase-domain-containing protein [Tothia fuscella]|uniref:non-specific serine/threonine protein kinase n=1 Tax=Tothia fuscella TaxID=1048955 RepID=A0A9P4NH81_9PEZI|nr:Pkinase-domain-containing protein [Tothia fuscella]
MDRYRPPTRSSGRRKPLGDATSKANTLVPPIRASLKPRPPQSPPKLDRIVPRNESLVDNGGFAVRHTIGSPENKRISKKSNEDQTESKRNSAISTTSTNASGSARKRKTHIGPWQLGQTIGKGGTARVREVRHAATGQTAVAKIVSKAVAESHRAQSLADLVKCAERGDKSLLIGKDIPLGLEREIVIMKLLDHKNIVRLYDIWENRTEIYLIMEYVQGGELFDYVAQSRYLEEHLAVFLFRQIVAALLYCHRLHIHHRDLKPENILLELSTMTVKLVDFGMAALQPRGGLLTTPCGSPHYAAPELLSRRPYDGAQADVWSCGVVLFVMLAGSPPFNFPPADAMNSDQKLEALFRTIRKADFQMPAAFSAEAQDLLFKIFVVDPKKRIKMDDIWHHPLLQKYNSGYGLSRHRDIESLIGPRPSIETWEPLTAKMIDRELFRNLRTLWHSEKEDTLVTRLCNNEANQEKYFYSALLKHREEQLENLQYSPTGVSYSASDYQHSHPRAIHNRMPEESPTPSRGPPLERLCTQSGFGVTDGIHTQSKHSFYETPLSEASYDPFRASRDPVDPKPNYLNVTVHCEGGPTPSIRTSSLRVEALRNTSRRGSKRVSRMSSSYSLRGSQHISGRRLSRSSSRMSINSSQWLSQPPTTSMRPSDVHKRAVQFSHLRRSSTASALTCQVGSSGVASSPVDSRYRSSLPSSPPVMPAHSLPRSRKENMTAVQPTPKTRKLQDIELQARKVSTELEMACDEAFFRTSVSSSVNNSLTDKREDASSSSSSSGANPRLNGRKGGILDKAALANRPLPPTPIETRTTLLMETPNAYTTRELAEMRKRLAMKYAQDGTSNQKYFNDVLRQLDKLMPRGTSNEEIAEARRAISAPQQASSFLFSEESFLDVIPEEGRFVDAEVEIPTSRGDKALRRQRSATEPMRKQTHRDNAKTNTIRLVHASSPPTPTSELPTPAPWAPLVIRKQSNTSTLSEKDKKKSSKDHLVKPLSGARLASASSRQSSQSKDSTKLDNVHQQNEAASENKFVTLDERTTRRDSRAAIGQEPSPTIPSTPESMEPQKVKQFFKNIFKKRSAAQGTMDLSAVPNARDQDLNRTGRPINIRVDNIITVHKEKTSDAWNHVTQVLGFGFKPASYVIPLNKTRGQAMKDIKFVVGNIQGITLRKHTELKFAWAGNVTPGVIKNLDKAVDFDVEVFQIDQYGRPASYSVVRITQTRGAASTLRKICKQLEDDLRLLGDVVTDQAIAGELRQTLTLNLYRPASGVRWDPEPSGVGW